MTRLLLSRRQLLATTAALPIVAASPILRAADPDLSGLTDMTGGLVPISADERARRLIGAFAAEQERNPTLGFAALAAAIVLIVAGVLLTFRLRPGVER